MRILANDEASFAIERMAFDRKENSEESVRRKDADGRLHVSTANISKACVSPYLGREIPGWRAMGLDPDRIYRLFRHPEELAKAAGTFNNLQLLSEHVPVSADDHQADKTIGSLGTNASYEHPYLKNSLVFWSKPAIDDIESKEKRELSSAYRYRADMTPGVYEDPDEGPQEYDGVMRDIVGNHTALVEEGRVGSDVIVGDSKETVQMSNLTVHGVLAASLIGRLVLPRLAQDAKLSVSPHCLGLDSKTFKVQRPKIADAVKKSIDGKLKKGFALDATMDDVNNLLDKLEGGAEKLEKPETADEMMTEANSAVPMVEEATDDDPIAKIKAMLSAAGVDAAIIAKIDEIAGGAAANGTMDDPAAFKGMPKKGGGMDEDMTDEEKKKKKDEDEKAMDSKIKSAVEKVRSDERALRDAERAVRPYVGEIHIACDSADAVYKAAFKVLGVDVKDIHPSAYPHLLAREKKLGERGGKPPIAQDSKVEGVKSFAESFPGAAHIGNA